MLLDIVVGVGRTGRATPYAVPPDNPFVGRPGHRPEIWATGLRNPWRYSFDRVTGGLVPDDKKVTMVLAFLEKGYEDQLLVCSDFTGRRSEARPGYGNSVTVFIPKLRRAGVKEETLHKIMYDNPRRFLAFVPADRS